MAAPERFAKRQIPLAPRAPSIHGPKRRSAACVAVICPELGVKQTRRHPSNDAIDPKETSRKGREAAAYLRPPRYLDDHSTTRVGLRATGRDTL